MTVSYASLYSVLVGCIDFYQFTQLPGGCVAVAVRCDVDLLVVVSEPPLQTTKYP